MKVIIVDDQGDQHVVADGGMQVLTHCNSTISDVVFDNLFYCEKCERDLLLRKMSKEPMVCIPCLQEEYSRGE